MPLTQSGIVELNVKFKKWIDPWSMTTESDVCMYSRTFVQNCVFLHENDVWLFPVSIFIFIHFDLKSERWQSLVQLQTLITKVIRSLKRSLEQTVSTVITIEWVTSVIVSPLWVFIDRMVQRIHSFTLTWRNCILNKVLRNIRRGRSVSNLHSYSTFHQ